jgi:hypothetical protein
VHDQKTATKTRKPLVVQVSPQLRDVLLDAKRGRPCGTFVATHQGKSITRCASQGNQSLSIASDRISWHHGTPPRARSSPPRSAAIRRR